MAISELINNIRFTIDQGIASCAQMTANRCGDRRYDIDPITKGIALGLSFGYVFGYNTSFDRREELKWDVGLALVASALLGLNNLGFIYIDPGIPFYIESYAVGNAAGLLTRTLQLRFSNRSH